jgi:hypothetical protein
VPLRVVRSQESYTVKRRGVDLGERLYPDADFHRARGAVGAPTMIFENCGFNELVVYWHADHIYRHENNAIKCFLLEICLAFDLFHAFLARNVKLCLQSKRTVKFWAELMAAELRDEVLPALLPP